MYFSTILLVLLLPYLATGDLLTARLLSRSSSYTLEKRESWVLNSAIPKDQVRRFQRGLLDAIKIATAVLDPTNGIDNAQNNQYLDAYFGSSNDTTKETVKKVFQNLVGSNTDGTGSEIVGSVTVWNDDYFVPKRNWSGIGDNKTPACQLQAGDSGKTLTAYTKKKNGNLGMHFCPKFLQRMSDGKSLDRITSNRCSALAGIDVMDTTAMERNNYALAILHELFHIPAITRNVTSFRCVDKAYGAWSVLRDDDEKGKFNPYENADTFAWYAMHIFLNAKCGRTFGLATGVENDLQDGDGDLPHDDPGISADTNIARSSVYTDPSHDHSSTIQHTSFSTTLRA